MSPATGLGAAASVQQVIQRLSAYWEGHGCALLPPCSLQIHTALLHPKTFFRLLDPQPWRALVVQPVSRPLDGRRGRHPLRTSVHLQVQVSLQDPPPAKVRDWVVASLTDPDDGLGLDPRTHDLFLDAHELRLDGVGVLGRGWRLLIDGVGVGRITFLERLADQQLDRPRVDITYGLEHLAMALGGVDSIDRLPWQGPVDASVGTSGGTGLRYDQLRRRDEEEQSRYVEEVADLDHLRTALAGLEAEARRCLDAELVRPAYERAVEGLTILDLLEARGGLSTVDRAQACARIRGLVVDAAELFLSRRPVAVVAEAADDETVDVSAEAPAVEAETEPEPPAPKKPVPEPAPKKTAARATEEKPSAKKRPARKTAPKKKPSTARRKTRRGKKTGGEGDGP